MTELSKDKWKDRWNKNWSQHPEYTKYGLYPAKPFPGYSPYFIKYLFSHVGYPSLEDKVLEIGCGRGNLTMQFIGKVRQYVGIDISSQVIDSAKARYSNFSEISFSDNTNLSKYSPEFRWVFSLAVFQHLPREFTEEYISQVAKILLPGGYFFFNMLSGIQDSAVAEYDPDSLLCQPSIGYSREETIRLLTANNFKNIRIERMDVGAKDNLYWWDWVVASI